MKKHLAIMTAVALAAMSTGCFGNNRNLDGLDDHLAKIKDAGKLVVGLEGDWQPFSFHDDQGQLVGYDVEVARNIAQRIGVDVEYQEAAWDGLFAGLSSGTYDIVVNGVDVTPEREQNFKFSEPYAYDHTVLVVRADNDSITSFDDLQGKTTANSTGSTYMEVGEQYGAQVSGVETLSETMKLVLNGTVDATINAETSVRDYLKTTGETNLKIVAQLPDTVQYAIPMRKRPNEIVDSNASLCTAINDAIDSMKEDGTLASLSDKYFGEDLTHE